MDAVLIAAIFMTGVAVAFLIYFKVIQKRPPKP